MDLGIANRVAIVGGSSKGIGFASAQALAAEGAKVTIVARHAEELKLAGQRLRSEVGDEHILEVVADLSEPKDIINVVSKTRNRWGRIDIVVNNIGGPPPGLPSELTDDQWSAGFNLNFYSAVRMNRLVLPIMAHRQFGRIISVLSLSIKEPEDNLALSTVARMATASYNKQLATEVAKQGITVNNILPGSIETDRLKVVAEMQAQFHGRDVSKGMEERLSRIPTGRFGRPQEAASLICFLASEQAGFLTGLNISIDGGQVRGMQ
jgi:3-oxoacyl-[acyl-carrier protein] reductase